MQTPIDQQNARPPLDGIRILDLSTQVPGPYCSMLLADLGADVIKIENTDGGDQTRLLPHLFNGINRNKKSIALNLKSSDAKEIFYKMVQRADVLLEGFRPGVCRRLDIDYETIKRIHPPIIYCSITGYGQDGPYRNKPGHDINYLGYAGLLSLENLLDTRTSMQAIPCADLAGSMFAAVSILAALLHREQTGAGQYLDVSMTAGVFSWMSASLSAGFQQQGGESLYIPHYGLFKTGDEKFITLGIVHEDHFWKNLCSVMNMGELAQLDLISRIGKREEIVNRLKTLFLAKSRDEWVAILSAADIPCGPVYHVEESLVDPQMAEREAVFQMNSCVGEQLTLRGFPVLFSGFTTRKGMPPPAPGMHTAEILHDLGFTKQEIQNLIEGKAVR